MHINDLADKAEKTEVPVYEIGTLVVLHIPVGGVIDTSITYNNTYSSAPNIFFTNDSYTPSIGVSVTQETASGCNVHVYNPSEGVVSTTLHYLVIK